MPSGLTESIVREDADMKALRQSMQEENSLAMEHKDSDAHRYVSYLIHHKIESYTSHAHSTSSPLAMW